MSRKDLNKENMNTNEKEIKQELPTLEEMRQRGIIEIRPSTEHRNAQEGIDESNKSAKRNEFQQEYSTELSPISEKERLAQQNLIDDSIRSTYRLAKHVMREVESMEQINPNEVNAACNAIKQMHSLLKLKLDIHKEMKK